MDIACSMVSRVSVEVFRLQNPQMCRNFTRWHHRLPKNSKGSPEYSRKRKEMLQQITCMILYDYKL